MTHEELLAKLDSAIKFYTPLDIDKPLLPIAFLALRAVVELHKPETTYPDGMHSEINCGHCGMWRANEIEGSPIYYPCPTIKAIEKELQ